MTHLDFLFHHFKKSLCSFKNAWTQLDISLILNAGIDLSPSLAFGVFSPLSAYSNTMARTNNPAREEEVEEEEEEISEQV